MLGRGRVGRGALASPAWVSGVVRAHCCSSLCSRREARSDTALVVAPVIAAMISWALVWLTSKVAVVAAESQHRDPVGHRHDVPHVVADEDDAVAVLAQPLDEVEHLGGLGDAEGGRRLVEHDDLGVAEEASARWPRSGAGRPRGWRPGCAPTGSGRDSCVQQPPASPSPSSPRRGSGRCRAHGRGRGWRRRRGCRRARGPGRPSRCRGAGPRPGCSTRRLLAVELHGALVGGVDARDGLDEGRLAGAVVADQRDDLARVTSKSMSLRACTAPNRLEIPAGRARPSSRGGWEVVAVMRVLGSVRSEPERDGGGSCSSVKAAVPPQVRRAQRVGRPEPPVYTCAVTSDRCLGQLMPAACRLPRRHPCRCR